MGNGRVGFLHPGAMGVSLAARGIYDRLAGFKGKPTPTLKAVLRVLLPEDRRRP